MRDDDLYAAYLDGLRTQAYGQQELDAARNSAEQRAQARRGDFIKEKQAAESAVYRSRKARLGRHGNPGRAADEVANSFRRLCRDVGVAVPALLASFQETATNLSDDHFEQIVLADERIKNLHKRWDVSTYRRRRLGMPSVAEADDW